MLNHLSLFAGIEGFGLAGSWLGWNLVEDFRHQLHKTANRYIRHIIGRAKEKRLAWVPQ